MLNRLPGQDSDPPGFNNRLRIELSAIKENDGMMWKAFGENV